MENLIQINIDGVVLTGDLQIPPGAKGIILFAHGSGSSRLSPRNQFVAKALREGGLATLLIDLLTPDEDRVQTRFNIELLTQRLVKITEWIQKNYKSLKVGYFGASTGAAAALASAAFVDVFAVVSRGGRPDLTGRGISKVKAPTLLIVGGDDGAVIEMNREALEQLHSEKKIVIIPGATHLFEESGALEKVALLAKEWFIQHLK